VVAGTVTSTVAVDSSSNSLDVNFTVLDIFVSELMLFFSLQVIVGFTSVLNSVRMLSLIEILLSKTHSIFVMSLMSICSSLPRSVFIFSIKLFNEVSVDSTLLCSLPSLTLK
jgi:hypothetical protein